MHEDWRLRGSAKVASTRVTLIESYIRGIDLPPRHGIGVLHCPWMAPIFRFVIPVRRWYIAYCYSLRDLNACDERDGLDDVGLGHGVAHQDLVDEVHDGHGWLFWFQLGEHVALIVRFVGGFPCHEAEAATARGWFYYKGSKVVDVYYYVGCSTNNASGS